MSEKRKDSKGRVLKDGESQRVNGTYDYRYTDIHKKRRCIYAKSLPELRKKEDELRRDMADGIDYAPGEMTVAELEAKFAAVLWLCGQTDSRRPIRTEADQNRKALRRKGLVRVSARQRHQAKHQRCAEKSCQPGI